MNLDARDVDLAAGEYERVGRGAALEDVATALLTGTRFGHEGKCPVERQIRPADFICKHAPLRVACCGRSGGSFERHDVGGSVVGVSGPGGDRGLGQLHHVVEGVELLQIGGAKVAEQDSVRRGALGRTVLLTDLAGVDGDPHLLFGVVVVGTDALVIQEGEHLVTVAPQAFDEAFGVGVKPGGGDELVQAPMQLGLAPRVARARQGGACLAQAHRIFEQAGELFAKAPPRAGGGELVDFFEFGEQVEVTLLLGEGFQRVVGTQEIGDEDAGKQRSEHCLDDARAAMRIDQVVALLASRERPQPAGHLS